MSKEVKYGILGFVGVAVVLLGFLGFFLVPEGHQAVVTRFGKAIEQTGPGLHFKIPLIDGVRKFDVRERKTVEKLMAATSNRLPITAETSVNWRIDKSAVLRLFRLYGTLDQFEDRIIAPRIRQAAKAALSKFDPEVLIKERNTAITKIEENLRKELEGYPVTIESVQLENITFPQAYMAAVEAKLKAFEEAKRERFNLEKQKLQAQRVVQTAQAERDAAKARADGQAYAVKKQAEAEAFSILKRGEAEAEAIRKRGLAIANNPLLVDYEKAKRWNGKLPSTVLGTGGNFLYGLNMDKK